MEGGGICPDALGEYVRYADVAAMLATTTERAATQPAGEVVAWIVFAEYHGDWVPQHPARRNKAEAEREAKLYGQTPTEVRALYAAPISEASAPVVVGDIDMAAAILSLRVKNPHEEDNCGLWTRGFRYAQTTIATMVVNRSPAATQQDAKAEQAGMIDMIDMTGNGDFVPVAPEAKSEASELPSDAQEIIKGLRAENAELHRILAAPLPTGESLSASQIDDMAFGLERNDISGEYMLCSDAPASAGSAADNDRILRSSVPERWKSCTSAVGAVQSYISELETACEAAQELVDALDRYPDQLVPINRDSVTVNLLRTALKNNEL